MEVKADIVINTISVQRCHAAFHWTCRVREVSVTNAKQKVLILQCKKGRFSVPRHPLLPPLHCYWAMGANNAQKVVGVMVVLDMNDAGRWIGDSQVSSYQVFNWCQ